MSLIKKIKRIFRKPTVMKYDPQQIASPFEELMKSARRLNDSEVKPEWCKKDEAQTPKARLNISYVVLHKHSDNYDFILN